MSSQRRLTMRTLLPQDVILDFTDYPDAWPENAPREYPVRGKLTVEEIGELFDLEARIMAARTGPDIREPVETGYAKVMAMIREKTPDAPNLPLGVEEVLATMAFLAGAESIEDAVIDAIRGADEPELASDGEEAEARSLGEQTVDPAAEAEAPLASAKPSPRRSSQSAKGSDGAQSGGQTAPGELSEATSPTSADAAAAA